MSPALLSALLSFVGSLIQEAPEIIPELQKLFNPSASTNDPPLAPKVEQDTAQLALELGQPVKKS